ncbi:MAG: acyl carrier protein [Gemmatimonas sp.]
MPPDVDVVREILFPVVDEASKSIPSAASLEKSLDGPLFGDNGLDSLGLVRFIVMVEDRIEDLTGTRLSLASDRALSRRTSPFKNLQTLADFIQECLADHDSARADSAAEPSTG